jgi:hypothetical protein
LVQSMELIIRLSLDGGRHAKPPTHTTGIKVTLEIPHCTDRIPAHIKMQEPTDQAEAPIPTETVSNDPKLNRTVAARRKFSNRTLPWDLEAQELDLVSPPPQAEEMPARKKRRLEEPFSVSTDDAARKTASPDVSVGLPSPAADSDDVTADPVKDTQPNAWATGATARWTTYEDAELTSAVANTTKKKWGNEYRTDWAAVVVLVPGRTKQQCLDRWHKGLNSSKVSRASEGKGTWSVDEDNQLKDAVRTHRGKEWVAIAALVLGRTRNQCYQRWHDVLEPKIGQASGRRGKWTEDEDRKLKDAVQTHVDKNWGAIAALIPGRTKAQCSTRWHDTLKPSMKPVSGRKGKWSAAEDSQLKHAIQTHADKDWVAISLLVPGRNKKQCWNRWKYMDPDRQTVREKDRVTLKRAPALRQDPQSPFSHDEFMA